MYIIDIRFIKRQRIVNTKLIPTHSNHRLHYITSKLNVIHKVSTILLARKSNGI